MGFAVGKVALGQVFSEYFGFPCQLSSGAGTKWTQSHPIQRKYKRTPLPELQFLHKKYRSASVRWYQTVTACIGGRGKTVHIFNLDTTYTGSRSDRITLEKEAPYTARFIRLGISLFAPAHAGSSLGDFLLFSSTLKMEAIRSSQKTALFSLYPLGRNLVSASRIGTGNEKRNF
jgi:hypothetical protein